MVSRSHAALSALLSIALPSTAQAASIDSACWRADEARASRIQALQTMLMVDAIKCQDTIPDTLASYNDFMTARRDMLVANKYTVQAYFVRTLGPVDGAKAWTDNDTLVANRLSSDAIDVQRCETTGMYARAAAQATDEDLLTMATILTEDSDITECSTPPLATARPATMIIPVWKKPEPTQAADVARHSLDNGTSVSAVTRPPSKGAVPTAIAQTTGMREHAAGTPSAAGSTPADQAETLKALQAAVAALTQVASSLSAPTSGAADREN